uniref:Uncharacterized protein n=1 Tax=Ascaris lumbricoides TaxID=6252 RepID=A0A0M3ISS1_ASCLU
MMSMSESFEAANYLEKKKQTNLSGFLLIVCTSMITDTQVKSTADME